MIKYCLYWLRLELKLSISSNHGLIATLFFLALCLIFSLAIGPDPKLISELAPAILWSGVLFSGLFGQNTLFIPDERDGTLDIFLLARIPLTAVILIKAFVIWLTCQWPLIMATPLLGLMLGLTPDTSMPIVLSLLAGTPALALLNTLAASLMTHLPKGAFLSPVLAMPFTIPIIIFGQAYASPSPNSGRELFILLGFTLLLAIITPLVGAKALKP